MLQHLSKRLPVFVSGTKYCIFSFPRQSRSSFTVSVFCNLNRLSMSTDAVQDFSKRFKESNELVIGTHDGIFHCDELLACFMLQQLPRYANASIVRTRDSKLLDQCDIVVDVGAVFDREKNRFDHHQKSFNETINSLQPEAKVKREIRLSSAGLIYNYFGEDVIREVLSQNSIKNPSEDMIRGVYRKVYDHFIAEVDAIDNGVPMFDGEPKYTINTHLSARVGSFNPAWNEKVADTDLTKRFEKAKTYVGQEFIDKVHYYAIRWWPARELVENAVNKRLDVHNSGAILELEHFCPWKEHLYELEEDYGITGLSKYVIYYNKENDWRIICVPLQSASFVCRKFLAAPWRGQRDDELETISGIEGATFCHQTGFIGGNRTRQGALQMAVASLEATED
ncbi:MYG1 protein-like isoform X1 [Topomyia yanbarensis]|uniref:MYG1 protein-like isoform X1 n=1 Tax=Topomyia yanbarensis TaxID=2498891 RepID=UPI00273C14DF|nr:MYG1 protein-like isoform X1 [Topomyia yanbarensis]